MAGPDQDVPIDCVAESPSYHTISTYLDLDD
jgi:hypothetical protein